MRLGYIGLGKMGMGMVTRLVEQGHEVVAYDKAPELLAAAKGVEAEVVTSLPGMVEVLPSPRTIWLMVPHEVVDAVLSELLPQLSAGDVVIDGGNSQWEKTLEHAALCEKAEVGFLDVGTSGGPRGAREGACLMIGSTPAHFERYEALFKSIAAPGAYRRVGPPGAGHFVKMVHNGIEYGMMQSIADGVEVLKASPFQIDLIEAFEIYNNKSVIESRLVSWMLDGFKKYGPTLHEVSSTVGATGEGQWTVDTAKKLGVAVPAIDVAMEFRKQSASRPSFAGKALSAMRNMFGGHSIAAK